MIDWPEKERYTAEDLVEIIRILRRPAMWGSQRPPPTPPRGPVPRPAPFWSGPRPL